MIYYRNNKINQMLSNTIKNEEELRNNKYQKNKQNGLSDSEVIKIIEEVERLLAKGDNLECINLLRALRQNMQNVKNHNLMVLVYSNLGILFYQVGFLEEAQIQLAAAISKLKQLSSKTLTTKNRDGQRIRYDTLISKLELQVCILYSEMGKHEEALEHAKNSSRTSYNLIIDLLARSHRFLHTVIKQEQQNKKSGDTAKVVGNNIAILQQLLGSTRDLKLAFAQKDRVSWLEEQSQLTRKMGWLCPKQDLELLYNSESRQDHLWIYKNKILDEIQLLPLDISDLDELQENCSTNEIIQKITYLAISLYCYSTETRFIEKQQQCDTHDVLDSEHWLSRSLEIAYCYLPIEAPILNQIITVHDRFHGLDKQTIPEDEEVTGFFKVLRPLSKPKSTYSNKSPGSSPIMIRIQADKVALQLPAGLQLHSAAKTQRQIQNNLIELDSNNKTIDLHGLTRNNRIRNYSHGHRRIDTTDANLAKGSLSARSTIEASSHPNVRANYVNKKFGKKQKLKVNLSQLNGKALLSQDLLGRPNFIEEKARVRDGQVKSLNDKRKRSLPTRRNDHPRRGREEQLLELKGRKFEDSQSQTKIVGGNVYINNNINLFISRGESLGQTFVRGQVQNKEKDISRRQMFLNRRRANNFIELE